MAICISNGDALVRANSIALSRVVIRVQWPSMFFGERPIDTTFMISIVWYSTQVMKMVWCQLSGYHKSQQLITLYETRFSLITSGPAQTYGVNINAVVWEPHLPTLCYGPFYYPASYGVDLLCRSDAIRSRISQLTLVQVMGCCLTASKLYNYQRWCTITKIFLHLSQSYVYMDTQDINPSHPYDNELNTDINDMFYTLFSELRLTQRLALISYFVVRSEASIYILVQ